MSSLHSLSSASAVHAIGRTLDTSAVAGAGAASAAEASLSGSCALIRERDTESYQAIVLGGEITSVKMYPNRQELHAQRERDRGLGFASLDCLDPEALILEGEEDVIINIYSTAISIPGVPNPCALLSYVMPKRLFERLQSGVEKYFLHHQVVASHMLTFGCQTLIKEILAGREYLSGGEGLAHSLSKLTLCMSSWLAWMELASMRRGSSSSSYEGIYETMCEILEEERALKASKEDQADEGSSIVLHFTNSTLSSICEQLKEFVDHLDIPFAPSPPKSGSLSTRALAARQRSQEEILKPLQRLRQELKQTVEVAIWVGSSPKHLALVTCLPLINVFAVKKKNSRGLLIDWVEKLDVMIEQRVKMQMAAPVGVEKLKSYIHAFREEREPSSMLLASDIKREQKALFPPRISLGFALENQYKTALLMQKMILNQYRARIAPPTVDSEIVASPFAEHFTNYKALPIYKCRLILMSRALRLYQMSEAREFNKMLLYPVDAGTYKSRMQSTLGSIGWLGLWNKVAVEEIPVASDCPDWIALFLNSTNALLRKRPSIDDKRIAFQLKLLHEVQQELLDHSQAQALNLISDYLANFHEIEALHVWTCAMSRHCILALNAIKKSSAMSYEEIDQLISIVETHRLMDLLRVSEKLIESYRSFIAAVPAPLYMADAFIPLLLELRDAQCFEVPEVLAPASSLAEETSYAGEVASDREVESLVADASAEAPLNPVIIEALVDIMSGSGSNALPASIAPIEHVSVRVERSSLSGLGSGGGVAPTACKQALPPEVAPTARAGAGGAGGAGGVPAARAGAGAGTGAGAVAEEPSWIGDVPLKSIRDFRSLQRYVHAAGMVCLRENGGSHSTWGAAGVKFTVACHRNQEISPKIRQRIMDAVKRAHEAMKKVAEEQSCEELALKKASKSKKNHKK